MERKYAQVEGQLEAEVARKEEAAKECLAMQSALQDKESSVREMERLRQDHKRDIEH